jgi:hypothetical protein
MEKTRYEFFANSEFGHNFEVEAGSPEEAIDLAVKACESGEGAPGFFLEIWSMHLSERGADGTRVREWSADEYGNLTEESDGRSVDSPGETCV